MEDGLASNGPHIKTLMENDFRYILGAMQRFDRDCNPLPDDGNFDLKVNMPELVETTKRGKTTTFTRVTDLQLDRGTAATLCATFSDRSPCWRFPSVRSGRAAA
ncbi:MAG: hypothetical protein OXE85_15595, partial [Roseovarius sp.]|nr:hypothetical protein [Roseovarius sp.]